MKIHGIIQFDENGRLYIEHKCEMCKKFPLENLNEPCLQCGYTQQELITVEKYVKKINKALDLFGEIVEKDEDIDVREGYLHLSAIKLGDGLDQMIFSDIDMTDDIRKMADLAEYMCRVIIYPTNIRHIESEYYDEYFVNDDENY